MVYLIKKLAISSFTILPITRILTLFYVRQISSVIIILALSRK